MVLDKQQLNQEQKYELPYHWIIDESTRGGRTYFGYLYLCLNFIDPQKIKTATILDAGCGDGYFLHELKKAGAENLYGIDYSQKALSFAGLLAPKEAKLKFGDLTETLPYPNDFFDYIFLIETLEHIAPDKLKILLDELKRILKKDGDLIITTPSSNVPVKKAHYQHFSETSLKALVSPFFEIEKIIGQEKIGFHPLKLLYFLIDNEMWTIKSLTKFYNKTIWPVFFNQCQPNQGRRLVVKLRKL